jgi:hypothetical protein
VPQINVGTSNITTFGYSVTFDILNRTIKFNILPFTTGGGLANTKIAFSVVDSAGVTLASIDFTNPQIANPAVTSEWDLDLSDSPYAFLFSSFSIVGAIQDQSGIVYQIAPLVKTVCMPNDFQETGSVPGMFQIISDCPSDNITVKELTIQVYDSKKPTTVTKSGTLYYPTGTISSINFASTPFTNNKIYTGQYRIKCTTYATFDMGNDFYVTVGYVTDQVFNITCTSKMADLLCCVREVQQTAIKNCDNAIGARAEQQLQDITVPFVAGILAEIRGMDASAEYALVKKTLSCNCGNSAIGQNEVDPTDPSVNTIIISGQFGTTVAPPTVVGNTKNYVISSLAYQVTKGNPADPGFSIGLDTSTPGVVKYPITLNYLALAQQIYTATAADPATLAQFNAMVTALGINLTGLDGKCIIDLTKVTYTAMLAVTGATGVASIFINGTSIPAPGGLLATDTVGFESWLNSLSLGIWQVTLNAGTVTILSVDNTNIVSTITFTSPDIVVRFGSTTKTLVQILQALVNYICSITAIKIALGNAYTVCTLDYNGQLIQTPYGADDSQATFNQALADATCNLANRIIAATTTNCDKIKSIFQDNPNAVFNPATDRFLGFINGVCTAMSGSQAVKAILAAVNADQVTKDAWCAIDCTVPATCPDIAGISMSTISGNIAVYGVTFSAPTTGGQTATLKYRVHGTTTWTVATNVLNLFANGNINGTSPYLITGLTPGTTYDVQAVNNCGGVGFIQQITVPSSSVVSTNVLLSGVSYLVCAAAPVTVYSSSPLTTGVQLFFDAGLTTPVTGYLFVSRLTDGEIFSLNSVSGLVGADTGNSCSSGTSGSYKLGNAIPAICSAGVQTLYTNGAFAIGKVLYSDVALTHPVTGFSAVVNLATNHIFNLSSGTGVVGVDTGTTCTGSATLTLKFVNGAGGSFLNFQGSLDVAVDGNISIDRMFADGFSDIACSVPVASAQKNTSMVIIAGATAVGSNPDASPPPTGSWASSIRSKVYNVLINGSPVVTGSVVVIGTFNVTISIQTCTP